jgi:hypothetical protein
MEGGEKESSRSVTNKLRASHVPASISRGVHVFTAFSSLAMSKLEREEN